MALALTSAAPAWLLQLAPLVLGIPHILAELRVFAQQLCVQQVALFTILTAPAVSLCLRIAEWHGFVRPAGSDVVCGCLAIVAAVACRPDPMTQRWSQSLIVIGLSGVAVYDSAWTTLPLAHAHNLLALVFLALWRRPYVPLRNAWRLAVGLLIAGTLLCLAVPATEDREFLTSLRLGFAPSVSAHVGYRMLMIYAFCQLLHYAVWLYLLPRALRAREPRVRAAMRTDQTTTRRALMPGAVWSCVLIVPLYAYLTDPISARDHYLALASFHGWLELAVLAHCGLAIPASLNSSAGLAG